MMRQKHISIVFFIFLCTCISARIGLTTPASDFISVKPEYLVLDESPKKVCLIMDADLPSDSDIKIAVNNLEVKFKRIGLKEYRFSLLPEQLSPGPVTITIKVGTQLTHTLEQAFTVIGKPKFYNTLISQTGDMILQGGKALTIAASGAPIKELKVTLGEESLSTIIQGDKILAKIPESGEKDYLPLNISLADNIIYRQLVYIVPARPRIEMGIGGYSNEHPNGMWLRVVSSNVAPNALSVIAHSQSNQKFSFFFDHKSQEHPGDVFYCEEGRLPIGENFTCIISHRQVPIWKTSGKLKGIKGGGMIEWDGKAPYSIDMALSISQASTPDVELETLSKTLQQFMEKLTEAPITLRDIIFKFVPISEEDVYYLGLSKEQRADPSLMANNLGGPSSTNQGCVKIRLASPFLIQMTEVTNEQYLPFLRTMGPDFSKSTELQGYVKNKQPLPLKIAALPVTNISYLQARAYTKWLQEELNNRAPTWQIRLPHEVEWEIAARTNQEQYTFPVNLKEDGLNSIREKKIRPVGTNPIDRSGRRVLDLSGNVREWTASIYNPNLLSHLNVLYSKRKVAWDPCYPYSIPGLIQRLPDNPEHESHNMCVRGGANGENPLLQQVSIRRQAEYSTAYKDIGFRLILVKGKP